MAEKYIQNQILYTREDETRELKKLPCLLYKLLYFVELDSPCFATFPERLFKLVFHVRQVVAAPLADFLTLFSESKLALFEVWRYLCTIIDDSKHYSTCNMYVWALGNWPVADWPC